MNILFIGVKLGFWTKDRGKKEKEKRGKMGIEREKRR
jgi:hypothetical protein